MKKFVLVLSVVGIISIFVSCKSLDYAQPDFERPHSFVLDIYTVSNSIEDNIRLINQTKKGGISFKVSLHDFDKFAWIEYGVGELKDPGDTAFIRSKLSGDLDDYRYLAIEALDGNDYNYNFSERSNDLYIYITER
jgi:hypothetical protein